jgi:hypothetical protein
VYKIVGSNPAQGMDVCLPISVVLSCVGRGSATRRTSSKEFYKVSQTRRRNQEETRTAEPRERKKVSVVLLLVPFRVACLNQSKKYLYLCRVKMTVKVFERVPLLPKVKFVLHT